MGRAWIPFVVLLASCGAPSTSERIEPEPERPEPTPAARAPVPIVVTNAGTSPLRIDPSLGLDVIDVAGALAPIGLHLGPYLCECACDVAACPCGSPSAPSVLAAGASVERTWDGALRSIRRGPSGVPCHERLDPPPGRYVVVACDASGGRCGTTEVDLPAFEPIAIAIPEVSALATCEDTARVQRVVRLALGAARLEGVESALLSDCDAMAATCASVRVENPVEGETGPLDRCAVSVSIGSAPYEVHIRPAARDGAPIEIHAWFDSAAVGGPGRIDVAETRWATAGDGELLIAGVPRRVSHTHGGAPAQIGGASFRVTNRSDVAVPLAVTRVEWLGPGAAREVAAGSIEPSVLPPRSTTEVEVSFDAQPAYVTWHQRFATRVTFDGAGRALVATVEHHVIRREPIRR